MQRLEQGVLRGPDQSFDRARCERTMQPGRTTSRVAGLARDRLLARFRAAIAQQEEQLICNQQVGGSTPSSGCLLRGKSRHAMAFHPVRFGDLTGDEDDRAAPVFAGLGGAGVGVDSRFPLSPIPFSAFAGWVDSSGVAPFARPVA